ncbi:MAG TPA: sigma 54-interacting transcriptional regulator [Candidatus Binatia bacterium]|nr:sigma 54-interacting transcriptional regulator [Candidatus Binatia bacterium]
MLKSSLVEHDSGETRRVRQIRDRFLAGRDDGLERLRPIVRGSWLRSRAHAVDPGIRAAPLLVSDDRLSGPVPETLKAAAAPVLVFLSDAIDRALVLLSDAHCRPIDIRGSQRAIDAAAAINVVLGSQWSEDRVGTDALAVSTLLDTPIQIHWSEHYGELGNRWTGSAAPIHHAGELRGTLSVYGYDEIAHPRALELVAGCAGMIEQRLAEEDLGRRLFLLERYEAHRAHFSADAVLCVAATGAVVAGAPRAVELLGLPPEQVIGRRLTQLPGFRFHGAAIRLDALTSACDVRVETRHGSGRATVLPVTRDGQVLGFLVTLAAPRVAVREPAGGGRWEAAFDFGDVVGESPAIRRAIADAERFANRELPVLVRGESGTGKELFAHAIHRASLRRGGPFVPLNCGGMNDELLGVELFGYADGAFTGASRGGRTGKLELADGGTLFLDEVEDMPPRMQAHFLRVLEEGRVVRLGAEKPRRVDVRVIAATKADLAASVAAGRFRADLYHRLNVLTVLLPPLRERREDVPLLARHLLARHGIAKRLDAAAEARLSALPWPGNVRELRNVLLQAAERAGTRITADDLRAVTPATADAPAADASALHAAEREAILRVLRECGGNVSRAAARLGVHRITLHRKMRRHGISAPRRPE